MHDLRHDPPVVAGLLALRCQVAVGAQDADHARPEQRRHERVVDELDADKKEKTKYAGAGEISFPAIFKELGAFRSFLVRGRPPDC